MAFLRSRSALRVAASVVFFCAVGCQAILGIDDTTFQSSDAGSDAAVTDASNDATSPTDAASDAPLEAPVASFLPAHVYINEGGAVDVTVNLARNGFSGIVTLTLASVGDAGVTNDGGSDGGGADGIGASPLTIPDGSNTGILHLFAGSTANVGPTSLAFTVTANGSSIASLPLLVGGPPGSLDTTFGINGVAALVSGFEPVSVAVGDDDSVWLANNAWKVLHYFPNGTSDDTLNATLAATLGTPGGASTRIAVSGSVLLICGNDGTTPTLRKLTTTTGQLDPTFFSAGIFRPKESSNTANGNFTGVAFSSTGDILLSAVVSGPTTNLGGVVYRLRGATQDTFPLGIPFSPVGVGDDPSGRIGTGGAHALPDGGTNLFAQAIDTGFQDAGLASIGSPADEYTAQKTIVTSESQIAIAATQNHIEATGNVGAFSTVDGHNLFLAQQPHTGTWDVGFESIASRSSGAMYVSDKNGGGNTERAFVAGVSDDGGVGGFSFSEGSPFSSPMIDFEDLAIDSVGRVVAAGTSDTDLYLARVWP